MLRSKRADCSDGRRQNIRRRPRYRLHAPYLGAGRFILTRPLPSPRALKRPPLQLGWLTGGMQGRKGKRKRVCMSALGQKADMCNAQADVR